MLWSVEVRSIDQTNLCLKNVAWAIFCKLMRREPISQLEMHDEIFHFEIFKNVMKILKYFKTPFLKYFMKYEVGLQRGLGMQYA